MESLTAGRGRRGGRVGARMALRLAVLGLAVAAVAASLAFVQVRRALDVEIATRLDRASDVAARRLDQRRGMLDDALGRIADHLLEREPSIVAGWFASGEGGPPETAVRLMTFAGLDRFEVLDDGGTVVASGDRSRVGLRDPDALPGDPAEDARPRSGGSPWTAVRRLSVGSRGLWLSGGFDLEPADLETLAPSDAALWLPASAGEEPVIGPGGEALDLRAVRAWLAAARGAAEATLAGLDGSRWSVRALPVAGASGARLVLGVSRGPSDVVARRLGRGLAALVAGVGLVAALAGAWAARPLARRVNSLTRTLDRIAAGRADYGFPAPGGDELDDLVAAFSRLQRALERERERSLAAERVAAWREVARHVAHEVKNPLAPIRLTIENLKRARRVAPDRFDTMFDEGTDTILEEVEQLSRMVGEFSEFARLPLPSLRAARIDPLLEGVLDLYAAEPDLEIHRGFDRDLPPVPLDADQMSRALKNVVANAVESMESLSREGRRRRLWVEVRAEPGGVRIEIADEGPGLSEEQARRLFEPYFTTKSEGTGLGMAITYRIVTEHGGTISAENRPEGGARMMIRLPTAREEDA